MKALLSSLLLASVLLGFTSAFTQDRNYNPSPMMLDVGNIRLSMKLLMGDGGLQSQYSWNLTGADRATTEIFYWPADWYQSNMLYQIFNPVSLDDAGILDENGSKHDMYTRGDALTNYGMTDWALETRRYRPPHVTVDGVQLDAPYRWKVDPTLSSDIKIEFEDVQPQFGIRSHVEVFAFSNPLHANYFIWKATHKFTGEIKLPRSSSTAKDTLPDQTIRFWWPIAFSFGPSKAGERNVTGGFAYEGEDDLDSWFKRRSTLVPGGTRDSLTVAYYWDSDNVGAAVYTNGLNDDTGDPDRTTGFIGSPQIPGYTLLHADKAYNDRTDDATQPYALAHGSIVSDLWGRRDLGLKQSYRGDDGRGRFPLDPISAGLTATLQKGPMRFITTGPYTLTKNAAQGRIDSLTFVYAVGVGGMNWKMCDSLGHLWMTGQLGDSAKKAWILTGKDSLWNTLDRANWAWNQLSTGGHVPAAPPPPDIDVTSGPDRITVSWSYPSVSYFQDAVTGVDDWRAWRVYRKRGAFLVNDPLDQKSGARWELVFETTDRARTSYVDLTVERGVDYYYAVTAVDNGTQAAGTVDVGIPLESSRFVTRSALPAVAFKPGLSTSAMVRVVPNPATIAAGAALVGGTPDKISFFNLPVRCTLRIFTETGDLVKVIDHYGTADHEWNQRTDSNQYVSSGIYILAVTDCRDINEKPLDNQFVKFVIVR
jgi:hypothetical protein